jgi:hypothetical protein
MVGKERGPWWRVSGGEQPSCATTGNVTAPLPTHRAGHADNQPLVWRQAEMPVCCAVRSMPTTVGKQRIGRPQPQDADPSTLTVQSQRWRSPTLASITSVMQTDSTSLTSTPCPGASTARASSRSAGTRAATRSPALPALSLHHNTASWLPRSPSASSVTACSTGRGATRNQSPWMAVPRDDHAWLGPIVWLMTCFNDLLPPTAPTLCDTQATSGYTPPPHCSAPQQCSTTQHSTDVAQQCSTTQHSTNVAQQCSTTQHSTDVG